MRSREYFESLRYAVVQLTAMEDRIAALDETAKAPKSQGAEPSGGGCPHSQPVADRLIDMERDVDEARARLTPELDRATDVLYGRSGRGGVAKECGYASADSVCGYYLYGMSWPEVAAELVRPDSKDGAHWCRNRAASAFRHMDNVGMARLADS